MSLYVCEVCLVRRDFSRGKQRASVTPWRCRPRTIALLLKHVSCTRAMPIWPWIVNLVWGSGSSMVEQAVTLMLSVNVRRMLFIWVIFSTSLITFHYFITLYNAMKEFLDYNPSLNWYHDECTLDTRYFFLIWFWFNERNVSKTFLQAGHLINSIYHY